MSKKTNRGDQRPSKPSQLHCFLASLPRRPISSIHEIPMNQHVAFATSIHKKTARDYLSQVAKDDKAACAAIAKRFGKEYWDGDRKYGYGGYVYDGRWAPVAEMLVRHYALSNASSVLDVGCGKGFLL